MTAARTFPWARTHDADQLAAFIDDLWGAAGQGDDLAALDAIERVVAEHRTALVTCPLTPRQVDVLTEIASGETYQSTAVRLAVRLATVRSLVVDITARLGARNMTHAAAIATSHGWLPALRIPAQAAVPPRANRAYERHREYADRLRAEPGTELVVGSYTVRSSAYRAARQIRSGRMAAYQPAGAFDARAYSAPSASWHVAATFTPTITERTGS